MFGMGGSEILVILIVALLFLGPDKLPDAAKQISKGIRDLKKQTRVLQETIENDEHIGGAIRDLKSALRGDEIPVRPAVRKVPEVVKLPDGAVENQILPPGESVAGAAQPVAAAAVAVAGAPEASASAPADPAEAKATAAAEAKIAAATAPEAKAAPQATAPATDSAASTAEPPKPAITLPPTAGERDPVTNRADDDSLAALIKPASGTVAKS